MFCILLYGSPTENYLEDFQIIITLQFKVLLK